MILETLKKRRSIRKYKDKNIPDNIINDIVEAALRAPSSRGKKPWSFVVISDKEVLKKLALAKEHGSHFLANAPLAVAITADENACDVWIEDASIAAILIQITAEEHNLGSCWIQLRKRFTKDKQNSEDYAKKVVGINNDLRLPFIIALGFSDEVLEPVKKEDLLYKKISYIKN